MKVSLIHPNTRNKYPQHPIGLGQIASVLDQKGNHNVQIVDAEALNMNLCDVVKEIEEFNPDFIGITARTPAIKVAIETASALKKIRSTPIILGGAHGTALPHETMKTMNCFDILVRNEGEYAMLEIVNGKSLNKIKNIIFRDGKNLVETEKRPFIENLDELPWPAYDLMPMDSYKIYPPNMPLPYVSIVSSRGCPGQCTYCFKALFGSKYRFNSATYLADEIEYCIEHFNIKSVIFFDDVFTINKKRAMELCNELNSRNIKIKFRCETRVNAVDKELLEALKKNGCKQISFGVESGCQKVLNEWNKGITLKQIEQAFATVDEVGIQTLQAYMMIGAPKTETNETIEESLSFIMKLNPDLVQWSIACPFPSTKLGNWYEENYERLDFSSMMYTNIASIDGWKPEYRCQNLTTEELWIWMKKVYRAYYFRPKYFARRFRKLISRDWKNELRMNYAGLTDILGST